MSRIALDEALLNVRYGTLKDAQMLAELGARTFRETFADQNTPEDMAAYLSEAFGADKQAKELEDRGGIFLIGESENIPRGYARLQSSPAPGCVNGEKPIELARLYVEKQWIGKGVGAFLMQNCIKEAGEKGFRTIWLGVWERNERAQRFYRDWGFSLVGNQSFQLGSDLQNDYVMERSL